MALPKQSAKDRSVETVEERFERCLKKFETQMIKWMFIFWAGQIGGMTAILFLFFKY